MKAGQTAEIAFVHKIKDRPKLCQAVFHRCSAQRDMMDAFQLSDRAGLLRMRVFNILRFIKADGAPCHGRKLFLIGVRQAVRSKNDIRVLIGRDKCFPSAGGGRNEARPSVAARRSGAHSRQLPSTDVGAMIKAGAFAGRFPSHGENKRSSESSFQVPCHLRDRRRSRFPVKTEASSCRTSDKGGAGPETRR